MNYFDFFDIPVSLTPDLSELKQRYFAKSKQYHPDFHGRAGNLEQAKMLEMASFNNKAWTTLSNRLERYRYVLELFGYLEGAGQQALSPDFLMEVMEIQEMLEDLGQQPDAAKLGMVEAEIDRIGQTLEHSVAPWVEVDLSGEAASEALLRVRDFFLKSNYLLRIKENLTKFAPTL